LIPKSDDNVLLYHPCIFSNSGEACDLSADPYVFPGLTILLPQIIPVELSSLK
jgi:hypothetical protein